MHLLDLAVIVAYLFGITWFGTRFKQGRAASKKGAEASSEKGTEKGLDQYFLGGRSAPWWAISLSIVSAETSTLTIIGTPALAFGGNFTFLQVVIGYLLARIVISVLFLPHYFEGSLLTAYQVMQRRFGLRIRRLTATTFLVTRSLAEGVRVFAISIVVSIVLGTGEVASILLIVFLTLLYTFEGGMTAVIWTDVFQMGMYVLGAGASFFVILGKIPGGWDHVWASGMAAHKLQVFDFGMPGLSFTEMAAFFTKKYSFLAGVLGGCFLTTASHGTDQLIVQRLLSARTQRQSRWALMGSWIIVAGLFTLFLVIGLALWVYYQDMGLSPPPAADRIYAEFLWKNLPSGLAGLAIAAVLAAAMANLSAALNSLASTSVVDFGKGIMAPPEVSMRRARRATLIWAVVLVGIGLASQHVKSVLESGLSIASVTLGLLLGVFLLGVLTKRVGENPAIVGFLTGAVVMALVWSQTSIAWTWWVLIGSLSTFLSGLTASCFGQRRRNSR